MTDSEKPELYYLYKNGELVKELSFHASQRIELKKNECIYKMELIEILY